MRPMFTPQRMSALVPVIVGAVEAMLDRWSEFAAQRRPFDVYAEMTELTRAIILRVLFGELPDEETRSVGRAVTIVTERVNRRLWSPVWWLSRLPTSRQKRYERALDAFMARRIDEGRPCSGRGGQPPRTSPASGTPAWWSTRRCGSSRPHG
jgi:cytochrome P450